MMYAVGDVYKERTVVNVYTWPDKAQDLELDDGTEVLIRPHLDRVWENPPN